MNKLNLVLMSVAMVGAVLAYVRMTQRGEPRRWIMAGVAVMLAVAMVVQITRRNRTTEVEIPAEAILQMMASSKTAAAPVKYAEPLPPAQVLKSIDTSMVSLPGGTFIMGSPDTEANRRRDEGPQHEVKVSPFFMCKTEVTRAQWQAVTTLPKVKVELDDPNPWDTADDRKPIEGVSWEEAVEFCARLSKATKKTYRLPTEAEWEYAARATTTEPFAGNLDEMAWFDGNASAGPQAVATKQPNGFGLYDMHGNVYEWCSDWYSATYYAQSQSVNPTGPSAGSTRVYRGGASSRPGWCSRSAYRGDVEPYSRDHAIGFRIVRTSH